MAFIDNFREFDLRSAKSIKFVVILAVSGCALAGGVGLIIGFSTVTKPFLFTRPYVPPVREERFDPFRAPLPEIEKKFLVVQYIDRATEKTRAWFQQLQPEKDKLLEHKAVLEPVDLFKAYEHR